MSIDVSLGLDHVTKEGSISGTIPPVSRVPVPISGSESRNGSRTVAGSALTLPISRRPDRPDEPYRPKPGQFY